MMEEMLADRPGAYPMTYHPAGAWDNVVPYQVKTFMLPIIILSETGKQWAYSEVKNVVVPDNG